MSMVILDPAILFVDVWFAALACLGVVLLVFPYNVQRVVLRIYARLSLTIFRDYAASPEYIRMVRFTGLVASLMFAFLIYIELRGR